MQTIVLGSSVLLRCHARGGYPTALVQWHDGKQGTFQAMNTIQSPDGEELLEVRSYLVLDVKRDQNVCCSFTNYRLHHTDTSCTTLRARWEDSYRVSGHLLLGTALVLACLWVARRMKIWRL
ncbi:hypothetical protein FKM82_002656 [Ascaphus truei]